MSHTKERKKKKKRVNNFIINSNFIDIMFESDGMEFPINLFPATRLKRLNEEQSNPLLHNVRFDTNCKSISSSNATVLRKIEINTNNLNTLCICFLQF